MKTTKKHGFIGLLIVLIVAVAFVATIGYSSYHNQQGGLTGQIMSQLERPGNIWNSIISTFSTSTMNATTTSTSTSLKFIH